MDKLFVYGTLAPGQPHEHVLTKVKGTWEKAYVVGRLYEEGWGADMGYLGIRLNPNGEKVHGHVFNSEKLEELWEELDAFEGKAYKRVRTMVTLDTLKKVEAFIYVYVLN